MVNKKMTDFYLIILILYSIITISFSNISNIKSSENSLNKKKHIPKINIQQKANAEPNITNFQNICKELFPEGEPAAAVLIMKDNKTVFEEYYGLVTLPNGTKTDKDISFNIASNSKQFTSIGVLQLVAEGKVSLEEPMGTYFPEYADPLWKKVKVKHLLSHCSGIPDARGYLNRTQKIWGDENLAVEYFNTLNYTNFEPGTNYEYINPTYVLLGKLIERISNQSFTKYMQEHIFDPAGMTQTAYNGEEKNVCHAYEYDRDRGDSEESSGDRPEGPHDWYEYDYGEETFFGTRPDGGLFTTPRDFVKWEQARPSLLKEDLLNEAYKNHTKVSGSNYSDYQNRPGTWYGYGWFVEPEKGCIYHTGDNGGFKILAARYPQKNGLVLVFAARTDWDRYEFKTQIEEIFDLVSVSSTNGTSSQKIKDKVIYVLQMQKVDKKLKLFNIINFPINKNETFTFPIKTYSINSSRILQETDVKRVKFISSEDYNGNGDKIVELTSNEEFDDNIGAILQQQSSNNDMEIIFNKNENNLDTEKVKNIIKNGGIDYSNLSSNYKIYHYSVTSSTEGCSFNLISEQKIQDSNTKTINLSFEEVDSDNSINAKCELSSSNGNKIPCKLTSNIENNYLLEPFTFSDNNEIITITQNNTNNYLPLKCEINSNSTIPKFRINKSNGLSTGGILGIVFGIVGGVLLTVLASFIFAKSDKTIQQNVNTYESNRSLNINNI